MNIWLTHSRLTWEAELAYQKRFEAEMEVIKAERKRRKMKKPRMINAIGEYTQVVPKLGKYAERILEAMRHASSGRVWTTCELAIQTGIPRGVVADALRSLVQRDLIIRNGVPKHFHTPGGGYTYTILKHGEEP